MGSPKKCELLRFLSKLRIMMNDVKKNVTIFTVNMAIRQVANLCSTGILMQTFLASLGFTSDQLYINHAIVLSAQILTTSLCSRWADKGSILRRATLIQLPSVLLMLCYLPFCIAGEATTEAFVLLTLISFLHCVFYFMYSVCDYKLPYFVMPASQYSTVLSVSGIISALISLSSGVLISIGTQYMPFEHLMFIACCVASLLILVAMINTSRLKMIIHPEMAVHDKKDDTGSVTVGQLFRTPLFYRLAPSNFLRGVSYGTTSVLAALALDLGYDTTVTTMIVSVQAAAMLLGSLAFGFLSKRIEPRKLILMGTLTILLLPLMLIRNSTLFLVLVGLIIFGRIHVDHGFPFLLRQAVPLEISGPFNAWRLILFFVGLVGTTTLAAWLPVEALLIIGTVSQLYVGITCYTDRVLLEHLQPDHIQE